MPAGPDLGDLQAFAAVAEAKSFRRAAAVLGASPSGLSEAVRRLESRLGLRLLNRTTRSVSPTEAGGRLLERLRPALGELAASLDALDSLRGEPAGTLKLNVPTIVARAVLPPIAVGFLARHPGVTLEVAAEDGFVDVLGRGFDAGVRYEERLEADMIAVPLGPRRQRFVCAGAPAYLDEHGRPEHPRDLTGHRSVRHRFTHGVMPVWEFERGGETIKVSPPARLVANALELELEAAVAGIGLIASFGELLGPALADGRLEPVLEDWSTPFPGPYLYFAGRRLMPGPLRAFVDYVKGEAAGPGAGALRSAAARPKQGGTPETPSA